MQYRVTSILDRSRYESVFQQIDVEDSYEGGGVGIRMFGVTQVYTTSFQLRESSSSAPFQEGHSVLAHVYDFAPYFLVPAPRGFQEGDISAFTSELDVSG